MSDKLEEYVPGKILKEKWWLVSTKELFFAGVATGLLVASVMAYQIYQWRVGEQVLQKSLIYQNEVYDVTKRL